MPNYRQPSAEPVVLHLNPTGESAADDSYTIYQRAKDHATVSYTQEGIVPAEIVVPFKTWLRLHDTRYASGGVTEDRSYLEALSLQLVRFEVTISHEEPAQAVRPDTCESGGAFKGVLWPRPPVQMPDGRTGYPVAVVGVAILDRPLFEGNEIVLAGACPGLGDALDKVARGHARYRFGTADGVLTSLDHAISTGPAPCDGDE